MQKKNGKSVVIPGMEPTGHYWFALGKFLQDNGMKPIHLNPHHVKKSKELDDNNSNKNDRKDSPPKKHCLPCERRAILLSLHTERDPCGDQEFIKSAVSGTRGTYQSQKTDCKILFHLFS